MADDPTAVHLGMSAALRARIAAENDRRSRLPRYPQRHGLADLLPWLREARWPPTEYEVRQTMLIYEGFSREDAIEHLGIPPNLRAALETYLGCEVGDDPSVRLLYGRLQRDFEIGMVDADRLLPVHLFRLLILWGRWRDSTGAALLEVLREVAKYKRLAGSTPMDPASDAIFIKALDRFHPPEPMEVARPIPPAASKKPRRTRREGKAERCVGIYMEAIGREVTPPTPTEIAREVGCNPGTASRAIARWEATRKGIVKGEAK